MNTPKYKQEAQEAFGMLSRRRILAEIVVSGGWIQFPGSCRDVVVELARRCLGKQATAEPARLITEAKGNA